LSIKNNISISGTLGTRDTSKKNKGTSRVIVRIVIISRSTDNYIIFAISVKISGRGYSIAKFITRILPINNDIGISTGSFVTGYSSKENISTTRIRTCGTVSIVKCTYNNIVLTIAIEVTG
jgi:hypothetical protein